MKKRNWKEVVVYDDSSEDLSSLPYSHTLFLVINSLLEDGRQPIMLIGGLRAFQVRDHWWHVGPDHECACVAFWREAVFNMHIWPLSPTTLACSHNCFYDVSNEIYQMIFSDDAVITVRRSLDEAQPLPKPERARAPSSTVPN